MTRRRRALLAGVGALAFLALGVLMVVSSVAWEYVVVFLLIAGDAVVPVFPSESTLNAASALAADGELELVAVIAAGALGAVVGDSTLYWISRWAGSRVQRRLDKAKESEKVRSGLAVLGQSAPVLIVCGRFVPGLRFVVNATMGLAGYPYRRFLAWSAIGGIAWSLYTCVLAYSVGSALADQPLVTTVISGAVTTVLLAVVFVVVRRQRRAAAVA